MRAARRLTLIDIMILIAALAAGLALTRTFGDFLTVFRGIRVTRMNGPEIMSQHMVETSDYLNWMTAELYKPLLKGEILYWARRLAFWPGPCLACLSLATMLISLRSPRPPLRRVCRQAGFVAGAAFLVAAGVAAVHQPQLLLTQSPVTISVQTFYWRDWWLELWFALPSAAGFAVAVAWLTLILVRGWPPSAGWPDRLGRILGACWIGMAIVSLAATWWSVLPW